MTGSQKEAGSSAGLGRLAGVMEPVRLLVLGVLTVWAVMYQLSDTVAPSLAPLSPFSGVWQDILFMLGGLVLLTGGRRPEKGWRLIGLGCICWGAGDMYWTLELSQLSSPPVPSWADAGYLAFCPLVFFGILSLARNHLKMPSKTLIADAAAAALATGAISAAIVLKPLIDHASGGTLSIATNLAYPTGDLAMLGLIVGATALDEWRISRTWLLVAISIVCFWVADSLYLTSVATNTYSQGQAYNGLWYATPVIAAWASWFGFERGKVNSMAVGTRVRGIAMLIAVSVAALTILVWSGFDSLGVPALVLATLALVVIMVRLVMTWRENLDLLRLTQREALTDELTGMPNRRALVGELERGLARASRDRPVALVLYDLDGFKHYNDNFGHPAGDALLQRLGGRLASCLGDRGVAFRMGGDEFCALIDLSELDLPIALGATGAALSEAGEGFQIGCSYGTVVLPAEAHDIPGALRLADQRMYAQKRGGRASASRQSGDVLLTALAERDPGLRAHLHDVALLAAETARSFGLDHDQVEPIQQAAELHDVGKMAIPDAILNKPSRLDQSEWEFIRRHTLIGERIINAAPALHDVAALVRASHENFDGTGYPDGLAGRDIPLGARIIAVCDAFDAMTTTRPYQRAMSEAEAISELRHCAGTQFDPEVVESFCRSLELNRTRARSESRPDVPSARTPRSPAPATAGG
jgi:two-component system cell cycle response regulator